MAFVFAEFEPIEWNGEQLTWADADHNGLFIRKDTRVYSESRNEREQAGGQCAGTFWLKNPGSAQPRRVGGWGPCADDDGDQTLSQVRRLLQGILDFEQFRALDDPYIQILNIVYATTPKANLMLKLLRQQHDALTRDDADAHNHAFRTVVDYREPPPRSPFLVLGWGDLLTTLEGPRFAACVNAIGGHARETVSQMLDAEERLIVRAQEVKPDPTMFFAVENRGELGLPTRHPLLAKRYNEGLLEFLTNHLN